MFIFRLTAPLLLAFSLLLRNAALLAQAPPKVIVNSIGMKLVRIEPGTFTMGSGMTPPASRVEWLTRDADEAPAHTVKITSGLHMAAHEVTNTQFEYFDPERRKRRGKLSTTGDEEPIIHVTWQEAVDFCTWLTKREGKPYRLPTEAEWEYACRAGTDTAYHTGDRLSPEQANLGIDKNGKLSGPMPVGAFPANAWGLHDMHGNVAEWCLDWFGPYAAAAAVDPVGPAIGHAKVTRGWSTLISSGKDSFRYCRSSNRSGHLPDDGNRYTGFRVVLGELPRSKPSPAAAPPRHQRDLKQTPSTMKGPDPAAPFFLNYALAKKSPQVPPSTWGPFFSAHNHFASVCVCPNGDVLAVWYSTVSESGRECAIAGSRLRAGADRWDDVDLFFMVPDVNCHAPVLFRDGKTIFFFCTQSLRGWDHASNIMRTSTDNGATWSKPQIILDRDDPSALSQPCSALRARDGALVLACDGDGHRDERAMTSRDDGKTWKVGGDMRMACGGKYVIHPAIVERKDGALLAFLRGPHPMPAVVSKDQGASWEMHETSFPGISVGQKATALRLSSGNLLLCSFDNKKSLVGGGAFAALSPDDGKTWPHVRKLEGAGGYMQLAQGADGVIHLFGSRMGVVAFNEAWVKEGK